MSHGDIEVITGCMFSGKSNELLRRLIHAEIAKQSIAVFKPKRDTRTEAKIQSRWGQELEAITVASAEEMLQHANGADVVGIDEAHFFDASLIHTIRSLSRRNVRVIVAGLDVDYRGEPFETIADLLAIATNVEKLTAVCVTCGADATRSKRLVADKSRELVGDTETYQARCLSCFHDD